MWRFLDHRAWVGLVLCLPVLLPVIGLAAKLGWDSITAFRSLGYSAVAASEWMPDAGKFGILPLLAGTLGTTLFAAGLWLPVGLGAACWLGLFAPQRARRRLETAVGVLGSIPTTVAGLIAFVWFVPSMGFSLASAAAVLALLNLPLFIAPAAAAIRQRALDVRLAAEALGLSSGAVCQLGVRVAWRGVLSAALTAFARSAGEALAVSLIAGNTASRSWSPVTATQTLGGALAIGCGNATGAHEALLAVVALVLVSMVVTLSLLVRKLQTN